jgi:protein-disulfide isomerase
MSAAGHPITLAIPPDAVEHSQGAEHAPVTLVEYGDYECPSCRMAAPTPALLLQRYPGNLRFIYRHFPLEEAHPHALLAAEAAEAAAAQGAFWAMHERLFEHQAHLKPADLKRYAGDVGLDLVRYVAEMSDHIYLQKVREHIDGGRRSHLRATPTFFVNGAVVDVSYGMNALHDAVATAVDHAGTDPGSPC